ncbi:ribosomal-protein-alanine acetyltransferase [Burkholderiales bacterium JOSHI_001]|nr:ribosomal-protein-alanine acetyltransferase [Burkholderiales bacterium JOSHI_001]
MSAQLRGAPGPALRPLTLADLDTLMAIEVQAYPVPWTRGNFIDSLAAGYLAMKLVDTQGHWLGYYLAMPGVEEMHLLNLTVAPQEQGRGHARAMLDDLVQRARDAAAAQLWLEVRVSNERARALYRRYGFAEVGRRRAYYPAAQGPREDAIVMSLPLCRGPHALV